jgi:hypothetical protein
MQDCAQVGALWIFSIFIISRETGGIFLLNIFQNDFSSSKGTTSSEEPKPELFLKKPSPTKQAVLRNHSQKFM